jgi:hypothetical protein
MSRPNLGYSNYYWIRQDQKRLEKLEAQRTSTARTDEPEEENITEKLTTTTTTPVLPPETKAVQESEPAKSEPDSLLPAPISSGFPTWTKNVQNP